MLSEKADGKLLKWLKTQWEKSQSRETFDEFLYNWYHGNKIRRL